MITVTQYSHFPNNTELGKGNTHECYLLIPNSYDLSHIFPSGEEVDVIDVSSQRKYHLKSAYGREFRINQMGQFYRDYDIHMGDEIIITHVEGVNSCTYIDVNRHQRVVIKQGRNGGEIINLERLSPFKKGDVYEIPIIWNEQSLTLTIQYREALAKRNDSPDLTDFYSVKVGNEILQNGSYLLTIGEKNELSTYEKTDMRVFPFDESIIDKTNNIKEIGSHVFSTTFSPSLQKIFYGAPGTGKSHTIQKVTAEAEQKGNLFRTTFHPDSDYATFVGCYKPSMESKERRYDKDELISKLAIIKNTGVTYPCHKFAAKYWESLKGMTRDEKKSIITACEFPETMVVEIDKGIVIGEELSHGTNQKQIVYRFVAQAFANAYVRAWQKNQEDEKVFLVIEEINRGNCAQIFGDLFQLLDRDDEGYSKYPIIPDADLADFICEHLQTYENIPEAIREGWEMKLPSNFYIWASMNTSDQSLFPIDSAFKRRWDWEYIPIENHPDEDYKIHINGSVYDWWDFIQAINKEVFELTHSEDKQLGYFFVRPQNGIIDVNMLVNKVYFYLWNDVFKDYDIESQKAFKKPDSNEAIAFKDFFEDGLNEQLAEQVLINLELGEEIQTAE